MFFIEIGFFVLNLKVTDMEEFIKTTSHLKALKVNANRFLVIMGEDINPELQARIDKAGKQVKCLPKISEDIDLFDNHDVHN